MCKIYKIKREKSGEKKWRKIRESHKTPINGVSGPINCHVLAISGSRNCQNGDRSFIARWLVDQVVGKCNIKAKPLQLPAWNELGK